MPSREEIKKRIKRDQDDMDRQVDAFIADLKRFLDSGLEEIIGELEDGNIEPALALGRLVDSFRTAGLGSVVGELSTIYGRELGKALSMLEYQGLSPSLQDVDFETLQALITFRVEDIENKALETIGRLRPILLENIITGIRPNISALRDRVDSQLVNYTNTELRTALVSFNRTVTITQSEKLNIKRFLYVGPLDKVTRPFCEKVLTKRNPPVYTIDEITSLDNGQGLDALTFGGGYNCRHTWQPVSDTLAQELGAI